MNRVISALLGCVVAVGALASCGDDDDTATSNSTASTAAAASTTAPAVITAAVTTTVAGAAGTSTSAPSASGTTSGSSSGATTTTAAGRVVSSPSDNVRQGDSGPGVEQIQKALVTAGFQLQPDGVFGPVTDRAVRDFQKKNGLTVDGVVGPKTWAKLSAAPASSPTTTGAATTTT